MAYQRSCNASEQTRRPPKSWIARRVRCFRHASAEKYSWWLGTVIITLWFGDGAALRAAQRADALIRHGRHGQRLDPAGDHQGDRGAATWAFACSPIARR